MYIFIVPQIGEVIGFCCDFLFSWLDETNILEVHKLADMFGLQQLETKIHTYILQNIQTLSRTEAYRQLPPDKVLQVLGSEELEVLSENEVYEAALHYHYSPEEVETDRVCLQVGPRAARPLWVQSHHRVFTWYRTGSHQLPQETRDSEFT